MSSIAEKDTLPSQNSSKEASSRVAGEEDDFEAAGLNATPDTTKIDKPDDLPEN
mgnify:FL=1